MFCRSCWHKINRYPSSLKYFQQLIQALQHLSKHLHKISSSTASFFRFTLFREFAPIFPWIFDDPCGALIWGPFPQIAAGAHSPRAWQGPYASSRAPAEGFSPPGRGASGRAPAESSLGLCPRPPFFFFAGGTFPQPPRRFAALTYSPRAWQGPSLSEGSCGGLCLRRVLRQDRPWSCGRLIFYLPGLFPPGRGSASGGSCGELTGGNPQTPFAPPAGLLRRALSPRGPPGRLASGGSLGPGQGLFACGAFFFIYRGYHPPDELRPPAAPAESLPSGGPTGGCLQQDRGLCPLDPRGRSCLAPVMPPAALPGDPLQGAFLFCMTLPRGQGQAPWIPQLRLSRSSAAA